MQVYSNPERENDEYALPNVEVWQSYHAEIWCDRCGVFTVPYEEAYASERAYCPSCDAPADRRYSDKQAYWFYWYCLPGCMPDSDPIGPFATEAEAIADAQDQE